MPLLLASACYVSWTYLKDSPFTYITQKDNPLCDGIHGSFCARGSYFTFAIVLYTAYIYISNSLSIPVKNALYDSPYLFKDGVVHGILISCISILINIFGGFIEVHAIQEKKLLDIPTIIMGMLFTGTSEEILYRALPINALRPYFSENIIVIISALFFGYIHSGRSMYYGITACISGLLLGYGFLKYGLYWAIGMHSAYNIVETSFYSVSDFKVKNVIMGGKREMPDDDGLTTAIVESAALIVLNYRGHF